MIKTIAYAKDQLPIIKEPVLIAIHDHNSFYSDDDYKAFSDVLHITFDDLDYDDLTSVDSDDLIWFNDHLAEKIIAFCLKHQDESIAVHCTAGISRSQAVALFIASDIYKDKDLFTELYFDETKLRGGNKLVYETLYLTYNYKQNAKTNELPF